MPDRTETEDRASASEVATLISTRPVEQKRGFFREHPILGIGGIILFIALLVVAFLWWRYAQTYEETDDAQIDGHINSVSTRVAGTVLRVLVSENQEVKRGDLLIELDPRDYQVNVESFRPMWRKQKHRSARNCRPCRSRKQLREPQSPHRMQESRMQKLNSPRRSGTMKPSCLA